MDTDDRDAHPPAMRWLFGEYTAAEAGNRPGLGRPTRRGGGTRTRRQATESGKGSLLLHYFSTNRVDSRGLRRRPVDSAAADKRLTLNVLDHKLRVVSQFTETPSNGFDSRLNANGYPRVEGARRRPAQRNDSRGMTGGWRHRDSSGCRCPCSEDRWVLVPWVVVVHLPRLSACAVVRLMCGFPGYEVDQVSWAR